MQTGFNESVAPYRLFQLISPSLPIGGFTYSQGVEWAVEAGWISDKTTFINWLATVLNHSMTTLELPIMRRLYSAIENGQTEQVEYWNAYLYACRETSELRAEEKQRGHALFTLLTKLSVVQSMPETRPNQLHGFCLAAYHWGISEEALLQGYLWSWAENIVMAGVKLIPLGQTDGQETLMEISSLFPDAIKRSKVIADEEVCAFTPSLAIASAKHETQYTRLFRS
ncbi:urease accessory protein UreF [Vibrio nigripulchritudo]|uniref:urease accessory protein UreF n=1 Tax=Vibrio nigripulchritudo TaxID=28173 RepID=UPI0003B1A7C4|nr:urease accessory protein UreF [Vibrio nigripulchritudo]CCN71546.1 Urease accessory protein ureF [Vibrio nigripulchritudo SFn118]